MLYFLHARRTVMSPISSKAVLTWTHSSPLSLYGARDRCETSGYRARRRDQAEIANTLDQLALTTSTRGDNSPLHCILLCHRRPCVSSWTLAKKGDDNAVTLA